MAKIKFGFCTETIEAPLWPEHKPPGQAPKHRGSFEGEMKVPKRRG